MKLSTLAKKVKISSKYVDNNPNMVDAYPRSIHYRVNLRYRNKSMSLYFTQGPAIHEEPKVESVIGCLVSDAHCAEDYPSLEDFAESLGYDLELDRKKTKKIFNAVTRQTEKLRNFLDEDYETFMNAENDI